MFKIKGMRHSGIVVENLEESLAFYKDILGLLEMSTETLTEEETYPFLHVDCELICIKLKIQTTDYMPFIELYYFPNEEVYDEGFNHIALTVEDIDEIFTKLEQLHLNLSSKIVERPNCRVFFGFDPSGNLLEFVEEK